MDQLQNKELQDRASALRDRLLAHASAQGADTEEYLAGLDEIIAALASFVGESDGAEGPRL